MQSVSAKQNSPSASKTNAATEQGPLDLQTSARYPPSPPCSLNSAQLGRGERTVFATVQTHGIPCLLQGTVLPRGQEPATPPQHPPVPSASTQREASGLLLQGLIQPSWSPHDQSIPCAPEGARSSSPQRPEARPWRGAVPRAEDTVCCHTDPSLGPAAPRSLPFHRSAHSDARQVLLKITLREQFFWGRNLAVCKMSQAR